MADDRVRFRIFSAGCGEILPGHSDRGHSHAGTWEIMLQVEGNSTETFGGRSFEFGPGNLMIYPPGCHHGTTNPASASVPVRQLVIHFEILRPEWQGIAQLLAHSCSALPCRLGAAGICWFEAIFNQICWEDALREPGWREVHDALLSLLLVGINRQFFPGAIQMTTEAPPSLLSFIKLMRSNLNRPLNLSALASEKGMNYDSLRHQFRKVVGMSPRKFLNRLRIRDAAYLLVSTSLSVKEVAERVGYSDPHHFAAAFKRHMETGPSRWRCQPGVRRVWRIIRDGPSAEYSDTRPFLSTRFLEFFGKRGSENRKEPL